MNYPVSSAVDAFHAFLTSTGGTLTKRPEYLALKASWPGLLQFSQPLANGTKLFSQEAIDLFPRFQHETTSIRDEHATERAIYFGLMAFTVLVFNKERHRYGSIDFDELSKEWFSQAKQPMRSIESYGMLKQGDQRLEGLAEHFLTSQVHPLVADPSKMEAAGGWFITQFLSGVLLGQIIDYLTIRAMYGEGRS